MASEFKAEAEAIHGNAAGGGAQQMMQMLSGGGGGVVSTGPHIWKEFSCKLREGGSQCKVPTKRELDTFGSRLVPYVAAQDAAAAAIVREFLADPGCDDARFAEVELKMGNYESSQLSAAIVGSLDQRMVSYVSEQVGVAAGGLQMLRTLYMPYYSVPLEDRLAEEVSLLRSRKAFAAKCDVYEAMEAWLRAYKAVSNPSQRPEEKEMREALEARCLGLGISTPMEVEKAMVERSGDDWSAERLANFVKGLSAKWQFMARPPAPNPKPPKLFENNM